MLRPSITMFDTAAEFAQVFDIGENDLVHATESYLSPKATVFSKALSVQAIQMILGGYIAIRDQGKEVLTNLLPDFCIASLMLPRQRPAPQKERREAVSLMGADICCDTNHVAAQYGRCEME